MINKIIQNKIAIHVLALVFVASVCYAAEGIANFHKIDDGLYRGACPTQGGLRYLKQIGVRTIIDFRSGKAAVAEEKRSAEALGIEFINIPFGFFKTPPEDEGIRKFLDIATNPQSRPIFIHCHSGQDRTGMMAATYRIAVQGWSKEQAYQEAKNFGFHPFYWPMRNFILKEAERFRKRYENKG